MSKVVQRFRALSWRRRRLLVEALAILTAASLAIRILPFRRVVRIAAHLQRAQKTKGKDERLIVEDAEWAIRRVSDRVPWRTVCFDIGLALHLMLRRRGISSLLHYGVQQNSEKGLAAHVWVSLNGEAIVGGETAGGFTCLATFPPQG